MSAAARRSSYWRGYGPYGYSSLLVEAPWLLGFNGAHADALTGNYALGNGHRTYNVRLMRFQGPDRLSPFGRGGLNAYAYCMGDPVNQVDPSGQFSFKRTWQKLTGGPKRVGSFGALTNTNVGRVKEEVVITERNLRQGQAKLDVVKDASSLDGVFRSSSPMTHKWLVTDKGELIVGSFEHAQVYSTHASFAAIAARKHGTSPAVVAAREFVMKKEKIVLTNYSGHYKTPYDRLWSVKMHMEQLAPDVKIVRQSYLAAQP
ncbi:RHS repeat-associated core domain-containing protein [Pseudomonas fakonensis]